MQIEGVVLEAHRRHLLSHCMTGFTTANAPRAPHRGTANLSVTDTLHTSHITMNGHNALANPESVTAGLVARISLSALRSDTPTQESCVTNLR